MNICVYGASSNKIDKKYIEKIEELGEIIASRGHGLVFGGGASGAMGAVARGAFRKGAKSILGIAPSFFNVDGLLFENCTKFIYTDTMRERKKLLEDYADAFIITPGGIGTFDELFEILTLKQLGRHNKAIAFLDVDGYWDSFSAFMQNTADGHFMTEATLDLYKTFTSPKEIIDYLENYKPVYNDILHFKSINTSFNKK